MTQTMIDCIGSSAANVAQMFPDAAMIAYYVTGSGGIMWNSAEVAAFSKATKRVTIDQGGAGSPVSSATVRDVETGAWTPQNAVQNGPWVAARPTIYCNQSTLPQVLAAGWKGDLWLAIPGYDSTVPPVVPGCTVVAVQNTFAGEYDSSIVYDPDWPAKPATTTPPEVSCTVFQRTADLTFTYPLEADHAVVQYDDGQSVRLLARVTTGRIMGLIIPGNDGGTLIISPIVHGRVVDGQRVNLP
jgi:hypothetical protein